MGFNDSPKNHLFFEKCVQDEWEVEEFHRHIYTAALTLAGKVGMSEDMHVSFKESSSTEQTLKLAPHLISIIEPSPYPRQEYRQWKWGSMEVENTTWKRMQLFYNRIFPCQ